MAKKKIKPEDSKRVKINFKSVNGLEGFKPIDMTKMYEQRRKELDKEISDSQERYKKETSDEEIRISKLKCPCCKSIKKFSITISHHDGQLILGGRNAPAQILADYNVCQDCGVMYVDLNKKKIEPPMDDFQDKFRFFG